MVNYFFIFFTQLTLSVLPFANQTRVRWLQPAILLLIRVFYFKHDLCPAVVGTPSGPAPPGVSVVLQSANQRQKVPPPPGEDTREVRDPESLNAWSVWHMNSVSLLILTCVCSVVAGWRCWHRAEDSSGSGEDPAAEGNEAGAAQHRPYRSLWATLWLPIHRVYFMLKRRLNVDNDHIYEMRALEHI